ncbi:nucleoside triphosphate pyrophosphohydrolase [Alkalicoccus urumqiensis]|uniref:Nucleoside triphosphate pyrophosphohydrolase n=1 Tax=Alkalicoccus urumqiensis TaxID=1548213 RepID=A0A2P6MDP7_ALKUR|nr:nucleoside triphosphate pyrophosphohydrolase [Alkalicoccus urumqiensis]PRO64397.1 nucleoside triphosphate pyrophosphohydrolase [Alkalicoccus urumqiensis]
MNQPHITIVGLGPGGMDQLSLGTYRLLEQAGHRYFRTAHHPAARELEAEGMTFTSYDSLYENAVSFEEVYPAVAESVMKEAEKHGSIVYAVPGHPLTAEMTVQLLLRQPAVPVEIAGGQSFLDPMFQALGVDPNDGFQLVDGTSFSAESLDKLSHLIISQVYDEQSASGVKLQLMETYPDDYPVTIVTAAGSREESILQVPLYELDRAVTQNNLTAVYVPPVEDETIRYRDFPMLRDVIRILRSPEGCPWDRKQTHESLKRYAVEEVYELLEAIDEQDDDHIVEELGDVLLQVMLHAQIGEDNGYFDVSDVIEHVTEKMIRRHPHVFGEEKAEDAEKVLQNWEAIKQQEKQGGKRESRLDGIPQALPGLLRALKIQKKAAKAGFDWGDEGPMWQKVEEEIAEWKEEEKAGNEQAAAEELGDVLFALVNVARSRGIDPEEALQQTNRKFSRRFRYIESSLDSEGRTMEEETLDDLDQLWEKAKTEE